MDDGQAVEAPLNPLHEEGWDGEIGDSDNEFSGWDNFESEEHVYGGNEDPALPFDTPQVEFVTHCVTLCGTRGS